jgi:hypothetical protein
MRRGQARGIEGKSDQAAMLLSLICLIHCLFLPIVLAILPAASHLLDLPEEVHLLAFCLAAPISVFAMVSGYRLHGRALPASIAVIGLALLGLGAFAVEILAEIGLSVVGSLLLLGAHYANLRRRQWTRPGRA